MSISVREIDARTGKQTIKRLDPAVARMFSFGFDTQKMQNATDVALGTEPNKMTNEEREKLTQFVEGRIAIWGIKSLLGKRGVARNTYISKRLAETTKPGHHPVSELQLKLEMDLVKVLFISNPNEAPVRSDFKDDKSYRLAVRQATVIKRLSPITGYDRVHIRPGGGVSITLGGEAMISRKLTGIRYEPYDSRNRRHTQNDAKFFRGEDARKITEDDEAVEADLWVDTRYLNDREKQLMENGDLEAGETQTEGGLVIPAGINVPETEEEPEDEELTLLDSEEIEFSDSFRKNRITFSTIYTEVAKGAKVQPTCEKYAFDRQMYYRLKKEYEEKTKEYLDVIGDGKSETGSDRTLAGGGSGLS